MKTRLVSLSFRGSASVDPRYSAAMLPWTINDIRSTESYTKLSVGIENGVLESYNSDFELQFSHPLKHIVGMCRIVNRQNGKSVGNGFLQIKQPATTTSTTSNNGIKHHVSTLTSSASYGSLSSNAAASAAAASQAQADGAGTAGGALNGQAAQTAPNQQSTNNFMEFTGPLTGVVYLMKDPKDPLLHIYLFECESVDEFNNA